MTERLDEHGLRAVLQQAGETLPHKMRAYLFGGGAMVFRNQKASTKDVDVIFEDKGQAQEFATMLQKMGYTEKKELEAPYELMHATGGIWVKEGSRFDVFGGTVMGALHLSPTVKERSTLLDSFGNLQVYLMSNEDVAFFKSVTDRPGDTDDIATLSTTSTGIVWSTLLEESKLQSGKRVWFGSIYNKLTELREKHGIDAPIQRELLRLDELGILAEAFKRRLQAGTSRKEALKELKAEGATEDDLKRLDETIR